MKKIFLGIVAYGDPENIFEYLRANYNENYYILIHYNKREPLKKYKKLKKLVSIYKNVNTIRKFRVHWGKFSILKCHLFFMKFFLKKTNCNIFVSIDNSTILINEDVISKISNEDLYLNLYRKENCVYGKEYVSDYKNRVINNNWSRHQMKYIRFLDSGGRRTKSEKLKYVLILTIYNVFFNFINTIKLVFSKFVKKELIKKPKCLFKTKKKLDLLAPFTISGSFAFSRKNIKKMLNDKAFWKIIDYSKNKSCPEEWAIHNYWNNICKRSKKYSIHTGILYFNRSIKNINNVEIYHKDIIFLRFASMPIEYVKKNIVVKNN